MAPPLASIVISLAVAWAPVGQRAAKGTPLGAAGPSARRHIMVRSTTSEIRLVELSSPENSGERANGFYDEYSDDELQGLLNLHTELFPDAAELMEAEEAEPRDGVLSLHEAVLQALSEDAGEADTQSEQ